MRKALIAVLFSVTLCLFAISARAAEEKWPGVDDTVVGKYAEEHGRAARPCVIDLEGDALLFAFLVAGAAGGFVMGYYYRDLAAKKTSGADADAG